VNNLIRTELLKQRTVRTFCIGVAAAPVIAALITVAILGAAGHQGNAPLSPGSLVEAIGGPVSVITVIALVLGVLGMAGEYRYETITTTFLATPRRRDVVVAKLAAHAITGAAIGALSLVVSVAISIVWLRADQVAVHVDRDVIRVAVGVVASSALFGALGVSIAAVIRNQTAACAAVLVWLLAVEGIVRDVFHASTFVHWLPIAVAHAIVRGGSTGAGPSAPVAAVVFAAYVASFTFVGTRMTLKRDVT
jgi:ABC-type transport system involved in multi-copper enzyme maturation permease subunit